MNASNKTTQAFVSVGLVIIICTLITRLFSATPLMADEHFHAVYIQEIVTLGESPSIDLPMLPVYHYSIAWIVDAFQLSGTLQELRFVNLGLIFILFSAAVWLALRRKITSPGRMSQTFFIPIAFPLSFLVYTDLVTAWLIVLSSIAVIGQAHVIGSAALSGSILLRQLNFFWLPAFMLILALREDINRKGLLYILSPIAMFAVLPTSCFLVVIYFSQGFVAQKESVHPIGVFWSNLPILFVSVAIVFAPIALFRFRAIIAETPKHPMAVLSVFFLAACFIPWFSAQHPFNHGMNDYFLRNALLAWLGEHWLHRACIAPFVLLGGLTIFYMVSRRAAILLPISVAGVIALLPMQLIEQRYYIPLILLMNTLRAEENTTIERGLWVWFLGINLYLIIRFSGGHGVI